MIFRLQIRAIDKLHSFSLKGPLFLMIIVGVLSLLACNPFAGDDEESGEANAQEVVEVNLDRSPSVASTGNQQAGSAQPEETSMGDSSGTPADGPDGPAPEPAPAENPEAPTESTPEATVANPPLDADAEKAVDLAWAFLSQCVSLSISELEARQINGQWFVQAAGDRPDLYGVWEVDPGSSSVEAHNIRAREWAPQINSQCTQESFAQFYVPTPAPQISEGISDAGQATTSLWATLVKCYPAIQAGDLQATLNPARSEWIVTGKPEVTTNYGVWAVRSNGEVLPNNRQAQGIHDQLDSGLC